MGDDKSISVLSPKGISDQDYVVCVNMKDQLLDPDVIKPQIVKREVNVDCNGMKNCSSSCITSSKSDSKSICFSLTKRACYKCSKMFWLQIFFFLLGLYTVGAIVVIPVAVEYRSVGPNTPGCCVFDDWTDLRSNIVVPSKFQSHEILLIILNTVQVCLICSAFAISTTAKKTGLRWMVGILLVTGIVTLVISSIWGGMALVLGGDDIELRRMGHELREEVKNYASDLEADKVAYTDFIHAVSHGYGHCTGLNGIDDLLKVDDVTIPESLICTNQSCLQYYRHNYPGVPQPNIFCMLNERETECQNPKYIPERNVTIDNRPGCMTRIVESFGYTYERSNKKEWRRKWSFSAIQVLSYCIMYNKLVF